MSLRVFCQLFVGLVFCIAVPGFARTHASPFSSVGELSEPIYLRVKEKGISLTLLSKILYGDMSYWPTIAYWNQIIKPPYTLLLGKTIILKRKPTFPDKELNEKILVRWRHYLDLKWKGTGSKLAFSKLAILKAKGHKVSKNSISPEKLYSLGKKYLKLKNPTAAIVYFKKCRTLYPDFVPAWFSEMTTLDKLKLNQKENQTAREFVSKFPNLAQIPYIQKVIANRTLANEQNQD